MSSYAEYDVSSSTEYDESSSTPPAPPRYDVQSNERVSLEALGPGSAATLRDVLGRIAEGNECNLAAVCRTAWTAVSGQPEPTVFCTQVGDYQVELDLRAYVPGLRITGHQVQTQQVPVEVVASAHHAVNEVLALAITERIADQLSVYAQERIRQATGVKVTQTVALRALQMQQGQQALRASCQIRTTA